MSSGSFQKRSAESLKLPVTTRPNAYDRMVDALCQIYLLKDASAFAQDHWEKSSKSDTTRTKAGLGRVAARRNQLVLRESVLTSDLERAKAEMGELEDGIRGLREKIRDRINSVAETRQQREEAVAERGAAEGEVAAKRATLMAALRLPHAVHADLSDRLTGLRDNLDRLRLPENTSAQFFEELVHEDECTCGRPMDEAAAAEIRARAEGYLDSDDAGVINAMKQDIERYTTSQGDEEEDAGYARVLRLCGELSEALRQERLADQRVRVLMEQLIKAGDKELEAWQAEVEDKEARHKACRIRVEAIEGAGIGDSDPETTQSLRVIRREIHALNQRIAQIEDTVRLRRQTELIRGLLDTAGERARERIKRELVDECNERLSVILENDPLVIERIDRVACEPPARPLALGRDRTCPRPFSRHSRPTTDQIPCPRTARAGEIRHSWESLPPVTIQPAGAVSRVGQAGVHAQPADEGCPHARGCF